MDRPAELSVIRQLRDDGLDGFNPGPRRAGTPVHPGRPADGLPRRFVRTGDLFGYQARAFLEQVAGIEGLPAVATFEDGLRDLAVVDAVTRSAAAGGASVDIAN